MRSPPMRTLRSPLPASNSRAEHFGQAPSRETIWLSRAERDYVDGTLDRELIDYADTPETLRYREEMATINTALRGADMRMLPDGGPARSNRATGASQEL